MRRAVPALLTIFLAAGGTEASPVQVDRVVAGVEGGEVSGGEVSVVTASEVEIAARLALAERGNQVAAQRPVTDGLRRAALEQIIAELLVYREAERLALAEISEDDVARARANLVERLGSDQALLDFMLAVHLGPGEIDRLLQRRVVVQRFVQTNVRSSVEVSDEDLARAYAEGNHPFTDRPLAEVRDALRAYLVELRFRGALERWVRALRERSRVRIIEP